MSRGGKRDGAGRPTKDGIARKRLTVAIREDILAELTRQAEAHGCSLSDRVNALLAPQLQTRPTSPQPDPVKAKATARKPVAQAVKTPVPVPASDPADDAAFYDRLLSQVDAFDRELATTPIDDVPSASGDAAEPVPTYLEFQGLVKKWDHLHYSVNRRSQKVQFWRKPYRKDSAFRQAVDRIASRTHNEIRDLLLDARLPLGSHDEVLALADLPADTLKVTMARILKGEKALKRALGPAAETFRELAATHGRKADSLHTRYYFFEEL